MIKPLTAPPAAPATARPADYGLPCDNCGSREHDPLFLNQDYISGEAFAVVQCRQCGLARTACALGPEQLQAYYGPTYYGSEARRFHPWIESAIAWFRDRRAREVMRLRSTPGRVLDIGCGRGLMLAELKRRGWQCAGTEPSQELAHAIRRDSGIEVKTEASLLDCNFDAGSFDVVTLWHVLEHLPAPVRTLREIRRILKPGGVVIVEVPNLDSWQARFGGGAWFHLDTPRHLYHFSRRSLQTILEQAGFILFRAGTFSPEYGPYGMWQTLLNRLTKESNVLYSLLKRVKPARPGRAGFRDVGLTVILLAPVAFIGALAETLACACGRGGIVKIVATSDRERATQGLSE